MKEKDKKYPDKKIKYLTKDTQLLSEFHNSKFFNISNLNKSNGLIDLLKNINL